VCIAESGKQLLAADSQASRCKQVDGRQVDGRQVDVSK
jgi:hypothetical protein